ncbi:MAG: peptidase [SAR324 cluster bacterium]|nr:peptidase [SAR324 cluster bacterium]
MTYCLGIKLQNGLVAIADTRLTSGTVRTTARKITIHEHNNHSMFVMTSGLRSVRDKAITYFEEVLEQEVSSFDKMYKAVNAFANEIRRVAEEDGPSLRNSNIWFNLYAIVGGRLEKDKEHKLYMIYPEGNWVESTIGSPYYIIGESGYGKPVLDRALNYEDSLEWALKVGYLSFDATRTSTTDVGFPIDVAVYRNDLKYMIQHRFEAEDFETISSWWQDWIRKGVSELSDDWINQIFSRLKPFSNNIY